jgi:hypothetical protein
MELVLDLTVRLVFVRIEMVLRTLVDQFEFAIGTDIDGSDELPTAVQTELGCHRRILTREEVTHESARPDG